MNTLPRTPDVPIEPLTERERSVLALMADRLSDREIADRLVVAYTTVKWYNRQIFNKLNVDNRRDAIQRGRELHLLEPTEASELPRHNLPAQVTPLIGRERELQDIIRLLGDPATRLVTILAPGGMGKTRLALAAAETCVGTRHASSLRPSLFPDGVYFVPLAPAASPEDIIPAIAEHTQFQLTSDQRPPKQQLLDYFAGKHVLLVLDNFEHLLEGSLLIADMLQAAAGMKIIVTSREKLNLRGETLYTLGGLSIPDGPEAKQSSAPQLFVVCAQRVRLDFVPDTALPDITRICRLVQGMPLAIELAAAWVEVIPPGEILNEITRSLDFLQTGMRDVPERQRSIRAVFDTAWQRLSEREQAAFRRFAVFRGGCTREAAQAVTGVDVGTLTRLVHKALLWRHPDTGRYEAHELLRQYAAEQIEAAGETDLTYDRHLTYYLTLVEKRNPILTVSDPWIAELEPETINLRTAIEWGLDDRRSAVAATRAAWLAGWLGYFWRARGLLSEARRWLLLALEKAPQRDRLRVRVLTSLSALYWQQGDFENAYAHAVESVAIAEEQGDLYGLAESVHVLGHIIFERGDYAPAGELFQQSRDLYQRLQEPIAEIPLIGDLGLVAYLTGDYVTARAYFEESLSLCRQHNYQEGLADMLLRLGDLVQWMGEEDYAAALYEESLIVSRDIQSIGSLSSALHKSAQIAKRRGDLPRARRLIAESLKLRVEMDAKQGIAECFLALCGALDEPADAATMWGAGEALLGMIGAPQSPSDAAELERDQAALQRRAKPSEIEAARSAGRRMPMEAAVRFARRAALEKP